MKKSKRRKAKVLTILFVVITVIVYILFAIEKRLSSVVKQMAEQKVKARVALIISRTVEKELEESGITYDSLVHLEKDESGKVTALETDIIQVNKFKSTLSVAILEELKDNRQMSLKIPIGTVLGGELTSGRGPSIKVNFMPIGTVSTDIDNHVNSAGINQTKHRVELCVNVHVTIITALRNTSAEIATNICIAETVIVGDVPETYTEIDAHTGNDECDGDIGLEPDDIFNFVY